MSRCRFPAWLRRCVTVAAFLAAAVGASRSLAAGAADFGTDARPLLDRYCFSCHSTEKQKGDLDLQRFGSPADVKREPKVWQAVAEQLASHEMPPKDKPQPTPAEFERLLGWANGVLDEIALAHAGDPGPVVLRRLSNAEYTYTLRDLTGVESLDPAREFPVDGAAGEGFVNTGNALVMSPALLEKYLAAGKSVAAHAVLLPDGLRFSPQTTRRDWSDEWVGRIRTFYRRYTDARGATRVNLQGLQWDTNEGGRLSLERYLEALVADRDRVRLGTFTWAQSATERGLSPKYLSNLARVLEGGPASPLLDAARARWRTAQVADVPAWAAEIGAWQQALFRLSSVGHIGKLGGPKSWLEPVSPVTQRQDIRLKVAVPPAAETVTLQLIATDAGDGAEGDRAVWDSPRFVAPGRPDLALRDVRDLSRRLLALRSGPAFQHTAASLAAAAEIERASGEPDLKAVAQRHGVPLEVLGAWIDFLGIGTSGPVTLTDYFTNRLNQVAGHAFVSGWGSAETPSLMANASGEAVRIPGNLKPYGVVVHPSPTRRAAVGWRSPVNGPVRVAGAVAHAHPECGNGVTWLLELRRGKSSQRLAGGQTQGGAVVKFGPLEPLAVREGDVLSLLIGPRDGNHSCDLTSVDLTVKALGEGGAEWDLAREISPDVQAGNPHADAAGRRGIWHFYTEPDGGAGQGPVLPAGSLLAKWRTMPEGPERVALATQIQAWLAGSAPTPAESPDAVLHRQMTALGGPFFRALLARQPAGEAASAAANAGGHGLDPARFGRHPSGTDLDPASLGVSAPAVVEFTVPADLVAGCEFVAAGRVLDGTRAVGSVQLEARIAAPGEVAPLRPTLPVLVGNDAAAQRIEAGWAEFRTWFPAALCYAKIVPVDEVVTLTLLYREDEPLRRLMLDDAQAAELDRLWDELRYVSQDALILVDAFTQLMEFATQDADPKVFEPLRRPIMERAAALRVRLKETEPRHVEAVLRFAEQAYRRPLTGAEQGALRDLYGALRKEGLAHEDAVRLMLARVFVAPAFLYRAEEPVAGAQPGPVGDRELATRLSYFLWSSAPDARLHELAAAGRLRDPDVLAAEARRMLGDGRVRRLAGEFGCAWLHLAGFSGSNEKSERHFPTFTGLRGDLYEEAVQFFTDFFQHNGRVTDLIGADYVFVNGPLAAHYGIPGVNGPEWRRVSGARQWSRGGILGLGAVLAQQSGASRTSPILRGNWLSEVVLGEKLPKPPKDVPRLPEDEAATEGLSVRQLVERHSQDPKCAGCHQRIDAYGFALEGFDAIGRHRTRDLGDRPVETAAQLLDGTTFDGFDGLREHLLGRRREAFLRQFSRKLLGYALGRGVQLSDGPLLTEIREKLKANDFQVATAVETIVRSRQFREIRGRDYVADVAE